LIFCGSFLILLNFISHHIICMVSVSAAMALPFSSFPNVNSLLIVDDFRKSYLGVNDFIRTGLPMSILAIFLISTVGYTLITLLI
jgi:phosphate transporter